MEKDKEQPKHPSAPPEEVPPVDAPPVRPQGDVDNPPPPPPNPPNPSGGR